MELFLAKEGDVQKKIFGKQLVKQFKAMKEAWSGLAVIPVAIGFLISSSSIIAPGVLRMCQPQTEIHMGSLTAVGPQ